MYSQAEAVGWGKTSYGGPVSTNLQKVELTVIPNSECNKNYPYQISTAQMCTFSPMKDICDVSSIYLSIQFCIFFFRFSCRFSLALSKILWQFIIFLSLSSFCFFSDEKKNKNKKRKQTQFDDGGPLLFTDTLTGRSFLIGLFSYGVACATRMARVLSRVTNYLSWILNTTNGTANYCIV